MLSKDCKICGNMFFKLPSDSLKYWGEKIYCGRRCYGIYRTSLRASEETKRKMSEAQKRIGNKPPLTPKGIPRTDEVKRKISIAHTGRKRSDEFKKKCRDRQLGKKMPDSFRLKMSEVGKRLLLEGKCPLWKGGISDKNKMMRSSIEYKLWRTHVFKRDNYSCRWCGATNGYGKSIKFEAHHIKQFALYPELRFDVNNGLTLCQDCHRRTGNYGRISNYVLGIKF